MPLHLGIFFYRHKIIGESRTQWAGKTIGPAVGASRFFAGSCRFAALLFDLPFSSPVFFILLLGPSLRTSSVCADMTEKRARAFFILYPSDAQCVKLELDDAATLTRHTLIYLSDCLARRSA